jgi:hypothetical protein
LDLALAQSFRYPPFQREIKSARNDLDWAAASLVIGSQKIIQILNGRTISFDQSLEEEAVDFSLNAL